MTQTPAPVHRAEVVATSPLGPGMRRLVLGGPGLRDFRTTGVGDEYVRLFLPGPDGHEDLRTYTVRRFDAVASEVTIDVVLHERGLASTWARTARVGDPVALNDPTGLYERSAEATWQVLVADATGLPAACRLMAQAPPEVRTRVWLEVPSHAHRLDVSPSSHVALTWLYGGNGRGPSRLEQIVRELERPDEPGYVWVAGETRVLRGVRRHLRHELGLPASAYKAVGYWVDRGEEWQQRWSELGDDVRAELDALWDSGRDQEEIEDEVTERLERLGL